MDAAAIAKLRKLMALFDSSSEGERHNAVAAAGALLKRHGKTMLDLPELIREQTVRFNYDVASTWEAGWKAAQRGHAAEAEAKAAEAEARARARAEAEASVRARAAAEEARKAAEAEQRRKKQEAAKAAAAEQVRKDLKDYLRKRAPARAAVIKRYGSIEAAIAPCDREKLLREAVRKWSKFRDDPRWTASISDHADAFSITLDKPSKTAKRIIDAIATAYPLPDTIEGAIAEEAYWHRRDHEFRLVLEEDYSDDVLDMPAAIRQKILSDLIDTLPARNVRDVLLRVQAGHRDMINRADPDTVEEMSEDTQRAVIRDLKALCAEADRTVVVSHEEFRAARQKRQKPVTKAKQPAQERQSDFGF